MGLASLLADPALADRISVIGRKTAFLFLVLFAYLLLGAIVFQLIEHRARHEEVQDGVAELELERAQLLEVGSSPLCSHTLVVLWAETIAKTEDDWAQIANEKMDMYEKSVRAAAAKGIDLDETDSDDNPWTFLGSLYYAYTVVTSIGYGNVCPTSGLGKLVTIVYGTIGIPLTLLYLAKVGQLLTLVLKGVLRKKWSHFDRTDEFNFSLLVAAGITMAFLLVGAILFDVFENDDEDMSFVDALYFTFVTISTIGFGDVTPAIDWLLIVQMMYSFAALSLCCMTFSCLQSTIEHKLGDLESRFDAFVLKWQRWSQSAQWKKNDDGVPAIVVEEDEEEED